MIDRVPNYIKNRQARQQTRGEALKTVTDKLMRSENRLQYLSGWQKDRDIDADYNEIELVKEDIRRYKAQIKQLVEGVF